MNIGRQRDERIAFREIVANYTTLLKIIIWFQTDSWIQMEIILNISRFDIFATVI